MSVSKLAEAGIAVQGMHEEDTLPDTAVFFAFDSGYLMPFKVMLYSMACSGALVRNPIIVCSDDPAVFEDSLVKLVADQSFRLEGELLDALYGLARNNVERPERAAWNKGTFLKWAAFGDRGYANILFLDVDMLVLQRLKGLAAYRQGADLLVAPQFRPTLYRVHNKGRLPPQATRRNLGHMLRGEFAKVRHRRINSGMMLLGPRLANDRFRDELIEFASRRTELHEQAHLTAYFDTVKKWKLRLAPSRFNFQERYLGEVDSLAGLHLLDKIAILHYAGQKPWDTEVVPSARLSTLLWWNLRIAAGQAGLLEPTAAGQQE